MNRRTFIADAGDSLISSFAEGSENQVVSVHANRSLPKVARTTAGVEPYTGAWGIQQAAHLLRRTMFGAAKADIDFLAKSTVSDAVDTLLMLSPAEASQPLNVDSRDLVPVGQTWVNAIRQDPTTGSFNPTGVRTASLKAWWVSLMLNQQLSIREKMVLFWHNHFATQTSIVGDPRFTYRHVALLRNYALGNFRDLTRQITTDGAMLRYLNGNQNVKSSPNENYARELQELFTIGKGPEVAPGDYTNYTEADVKAAARVLTGWRDYTNPDGTVGTVTWVFDPSRHDTGDKQFSARYQNTVITGGTDGGAELDALLTMIFNQPETARFICRKLYRWFVYYIIDDTVEANVIGPMADLLRASNYDILPVLSLLLKSAHFYDPLNMGCGIKNPLDHGIGMCRQWAIAFPSSPVTTQYAMWYYLWAQGASMGLDLGDPPNVAGWSSYYQTPEFYELWINSDTLPKRSRLTDTLTRNGYSTGGASLHVDPLAFVAGLSDPNDPNVVIAETAQYLFPFEITDNQKAFLKETLIPGLPDYEWTTEWLGYVADPTNSQKLAPVRSKLQTLFSFMMEMPEYQLF